MIALRAVLLALAATAALVALGTPAAEMPASAVRLETAAVVALLAPLFWPGRAGAAMARRIALWTLLAALVAAALMPVLGHAPQPASAVAATSATLAALLAVVHAAAAAFEQHRRHAGDDAARALEVAGRSASLALLVLGSLPLWAGPLAQAFAAGATWPIDATLAVSPLTHLAVASGNDLLRNEWLYVRSNLATLPAEYPALPGIAGAYAVALLALVAAAVWRARRARLPVPDLQEISR